MAGEFVSIPLMTPRISVFSAFLMWAISAFWLFNPQKQSLIYQIFASFSYDLNHLQSTPTLIIFRTISDAFGDVARSPEASYPRLPSLTHLWSFGLRKTRRLIICYFQGLFLAVVNPVIS